MSLREEQCNKVCRILDDVLANRPTERDSLIVAVRKAFAEPEPSQVARDIATIIENEKDMRVILERKTGWWIPMEVSSGRDSWKCSVCGRRARGKLENLPYCHCGAKMLTYTGKEDGGGAD